MAAFEADLVLEGGGSKGIGLVGATCRLQVDVGIKRVAGSSAGALVAALVAAGYEGDELRDSCSRSRSPRCPSPTCSTGCR